LHCNVACNCKCNVALCTALVSWKATGRAAAEGALSPLVFPSPPRLPAPRARTHARIDPAAII